MRPGRCRTFKYLALAAPLAAALWFKPVGAVSVSGIAVDSAGSTDEVGFTEIRDMGSGNVEAIKYFIPLSEQYNGTYGVATTDACPDGYPGSPGGAGTCSDSGFGNQSNYDAADALYMNIFFDLSDTLAAQSAELKFVFDDLDLIPNNDPYKFFESVSLAYYQTDGADSFVLPPEVLQTTVKNEGQIAPDVLADPNLISWNFDLLMISALNASMIDAGGFWIRLGFGSLYDKTCSHCNPTNTAEFLTAELHISPIPVPASIWLFGTALLGFIGFSRRTSI